MKIIILSDSFKGTLSSVQVGKALKEILQSEFPSVKYYAMADGGEGTTDALLLAKSAKRINVDVVDAHMEKINVYYGVDEYDTAYMDVASVVGFAANARHNLNAMTASTYGIGMMIKDAVNKGIKKIYLGLGGSITSDCGCGIACALGRKFYNDKGESFLPTAENLVDVVRFEDTGMLDIKDVSITCLCDVNNPLYGEKGAAYVFAPQKGATAEGVKLIDKGLVNVARVLRNVNPCAPGMGAAGGIMFMLNSLVKVDSISGADYILDQIDFDKIIDDSTILITGEGCLDEQTFYGKLISKIIEKVQNKKASVIAICGMSKISEEVARIHGIEKIFLLNNGDKTPDEIKKDAISDLEKAGLRLKSYLINKEHIEEKGA